MEIKTKKLTVKTKKNPEFIDITDQVVSFVDETGVKNGLVAICSQHTTAAIKINENEPLLIKDMENFLSQIAPQEALYNHNDFKKRTVNMNKDECPNGHSHCQHLLLGTSETLPIINGQIPFGLWQRVFLIELDHAREREVIIQVIGE